MHEKETTDNFLNNLSLSSSSLSSVPLAKCLYETYTVHFTHAIRRSCLTYFKGYSTIFMHKELISFCSYIKKKGQCSFSCKMKVCRESRGVLVMLDIRNVFYNRKWKEKVLVCQLGRDFQCDNTSFALCCFSMQLQVSKHSWRIFFRSR